MKSLIVLVLCVASMIIFNCQSGEKNDTPTFTISHEDEVGRVDLSDIMTMDGAVALETRSDNLLPAFVNIIPAGKYILIVEGGNTRVQQYSRDGKFIRFLLTSGNGPNEYFGFAASAVDTKNYILYYSHFGDKQHISAVNMDTGEHLAKISLPTSKLSRELTGSVLKSMTLLNESTLLCVPFDARGTYFVFTVDTNGKFLKGIAPQDSTHFLYLMPFASDEVHLSRRNTKSNVDTVYTFSIDNKLIPAAIVKIAPKDLDGNQSLDWEVTIETPTKLLVTYGIYTVNMTNGKITRAKIERTHHLVDKSSSKSTMFTNYYIEYLGGFDSKTMRPYEIGRSGLEAVAKVDAFEFRQHASTALKRADLSPEVRTRLEKLMSEVKDDSNPIVLLGQLK